jgi:hypothetical protein
MRRCMPQSFRYPLCLETPILIPWALLLLTWKSLLCGVARIPVHSDSWLAVHWPPSPLPFPPRSLFPFPHGFPFQIYVLLRWHCDIGFTQSDTLWMMDIVYILLPLLSTLFAPPGQNMCVYIVLGLKYVRFFHIYCIQRIIKGRFIELDLLITCVIKGTVLQDI